MEQKNKRERCIFMYLIICLFGCLLTVFIITSGYAQLTQPRFSNSATSALSDTLDVFDEKLMVHHPYDVVKINEREVIRELKKKYKVKSSHCARGYSYKDANYIFFHTNIDYPNQDEFSKWENFMEMTIGLANSHFLRSGWYVQGKTDYYFIDKYVNTESDKLTFCKFTFFDLNGKLAIICYEFNNAEHLDQSPFKISLIPQSQPRNLFSKASANSNVSMKP